MGDPRKIRKSYQTPNHPWVGSRIEDERNLRQEFGLGNKKEIWRMGSVLSQFKDRAKKLLARRDKQAEIEQQQLISRMTKLGLIKQGAGFDDILGLGIKDVLQRRLQSVMIKQHLARTPKQARQMITHRHVTVDGKVVTSPGFLVTVSEESNIMFVNRSPFVSAEHPERFSEEELKQKHEREESKTKKTDNTDEEVLAFSEKDIEQAEVLAGEKKVESVTEETKEEALKKAETKEAPKEESKPAKDEKAEVKKDE